MPESSKAVFLSYASQDAEAAQHICDTLRAAGIEVWFDQSELRGGDVWDHKIRKQIHDCALFIPLISANTQARPEGYFRLEWRLADQRTHLMGRSRAFLLPACIDDTADADADAPDSFLAVQWTRLPAGKTPTAFVERVTRLLSPEPAHAAVEARWPAVPQPAAAPRQPASSPATSRKAHWVLLVIAAVAVIGVGYFALDKFVLSKRGAGTEQPSAQPAQAVAPAQSAIPEKSIAVLPFIDLSEKKDQEYFSDGLADELLDLLSQVQDLRVPGRTSSFSFKGKSDDISTIAQKLRVAHVLEGSVRKAGNTIRVTVQLIRADSGYHLWSKTYDRDLKDIFKVQDEIAAAVVEALKVRLLPTQRLVNQHHTANLEAYAQYLLGNQLRARDTIETNLKALVAYRKAVALDPQYAAAYSGLAVSEWRVADQSTGEVAAYKRAAAAADKAIALAPASPDGYWARGHLRYVNFFDWSGAQKDLDKSLALDPSDVQTLVSYGRLLATIGRVPDAIAMTRKALELDPLSVEAWDWLSYYLMSVGQLRAAQEGIKRELDINLAGTANETGWYVALLADGPQAALAAAANRFREGALFGTAVAEHSLGHATESQRALDILISERADTWAFQIACVYAWRGEKNKAFEWLERGYRQSDAGMTRLTLDPLLAGLRRDPRFKTLLRKMNLPE